MPAIRTQIAVTLIAYLLVHVTQAAQPKPHPAVLILLIVRTHLFARRPITELLDPRQPPPPKPKAPPNQLRLPICM